MGKEAIIMLLGAWVAVQPFLGFPNAWDTFFYLVAGVSVFMLAVLVRRDVVSREVRHARRADTYAQNVPPETDGYDAHERSADEAHSEYEEKESDDE